MQWNCLHVDLYADYSQQEYTPGLQSREYCTYVATLPEPYPTEFFIQHFYFYFLNRIVTQVRTRTYEYCTQVEYVLAVIALVFGLIGVA